MALDPISAIETALGINRKATVIAIGGFIVLALAIGLSQMLDGAELNFWQLLAALVAVMVLMIGLTALPVLARRLISWVVALSFAAITMAATAQAVTRNGIPGLAPVSCLVSFYFAASCNLSPARDGVVAADTPATPPDPDAGFTTRNVPAGTMPELAADTRVFIQFAGYPRDRIVELATALAGQGWPVQAADRGGERISAASGLNEVRYFNAADRDAATALASAVSASLSGAALTLTDLSQTSYGRANPGYLEVWVSR